MRIRRVSLDIIRCIAILMIFTFHFSGTIGIIDSIFYGYQNGGWGCVGTTMFFVLSGFLMRECYNDMESVGLFYKKRLLAIIPLQIICFLVGYIIHSIRVSDFFYGGEPWKIIFSLIGIDAYLQFYYISNYYVIGEWFTAIILLLYILFPLLRKLFNKHMLVTTICLTLSYLGNIIWGFQNIVPDASVYTGVYMFWLGMLIQKYVHQIVKRKYLLVLPIILLLLIVNVKLPGYALIWKNLLGISIFMILLIALWQMKPDKRFTNVVCFISDISFAVYLCHHYIINWIASCLWNYNTTTTARIIMYLLSLGVTILVSMVLIGCMTKIKKRLSEMKNGAA